MLKPSTPLRVIVWLAAWTPATTQTRQPDVPTAAENRQKALQVLRRGQQAAGGLDRLLAVRDLTRQLNMRENASGAKASETVEVILPSTIRLTQHFENMEVSAFFDGITGWFLPSWQRDAAAQELMRQLEVLLQSDRDGRNTIEYVKSGKVEEKAVDVLDISSPTGGKLRLTIDSASGEALALEYPHIGPRGPVETYAEFYSDYRKLSNGVRVPFKIRTLSDGRPYMETEVGSVRYNLGLRSNVLGRKDPLGIE
jgi:hypothetical protein